jgi:hypothetical protein
MVRYPHTASLIIRSDSENGKPILDDNNDPIVNAEPTKIELTGRYEPNSGKKNLDYSAKFYTSRLDSVPFSKDGHSLEFEGMEFSVVQLYNYQNHCEVWLE